MSCLQVGTYSHNRIQTNRRLQLFINPQNRGYRSRVGQTSGLQQDVVKPARIKVRKQVMDSDSSNVTDLELDNVPKRAIWLLICSKRTRDVGRQEHTCPYVASVAQGPAQNYV